MMQGMGLSYWGQKAGQEEQFQRLIVWPSSAPIKARNKPQSPASSTPPSSSPGHQLEHRVIAGQWSKSFSRGAGRHREIPLHCQLVAIEVGFQDLRLFIL